jgi:hypothetical protein
MRPSSSGFGAVLATAVLLTPLGGSAQTIPSPYSYLERRQEMGLFSGHVGVDAGRFGYGPSGGVPYGLRYGIELSGPISFEGVAGMIDGTRDVVDPGRPEGDRVIGQADALITTIDARLKFSVTGRRSWHRLSPFLTVGGGIALDLAGSSELDDVLLPEDVFEFGSSFVGTVGLGTRWFVTDRVALRGEGVFSLWKIETPPGFSDPNRNFGEVSDGEWLRGTSLTLSLLYRW